MQYYTSTAFHNVQLPLDQFTQVRWTLTSILYLHLQHMQYSTSIHSYLLWCCIKSLSMAVFQSISSLGKCSFRAFNPVGEITRTSHLMTDPIDHVRELSFTFFIPCLFPYNSLSCVYNILIHTAKNYLEICQPPGLYSLISDAVTDRPEALRTISK